MEATHIRTFRTVADLRSALDRPRREGASIGLVPTMGAFHDGHLALIAAAGERCDLVVVSLFVNPAQFRPGEDLSAYPRDEERDARLAAEQGADILFAPASGDVYPPGFATKVAVSGITEVLCGDRSRRGPEHFDGVTTVVLKLLNMVGPHVAFFGQKDAQQALVIRRMVRDLDVPVEIDVQPTVREPDGLAMSSRNAYLSPDERRRATAIKRALDAAAHAVEEGRLDATTVLGAARSELTSAGIEPEYLELRDTDDLESADHVGAQTLLAVAAQVGRARLIDNRVLSGSAPREDRKDS